MNNDHKTALNKSALFVFFSDNMLITQTSLLGWLVYIPRRLRIKETLPLMLLYGLWESTEALWQNELQMWVFWKRDTQTKRERGWLRKSLQDCRNSVSAFIFFLFKRIILDIKAAQILLSYTATCPDFGTVLMSLTISLFHLFSSKGPNDATELWKRALYRGVLLVACAAAGGRQKHGDVSSPLRG